MRHCEACGVPAGTWSDDTSMTLCLLDSLAGGIDYDDVMAKFERWLTVGAYTQHGEAFGVGRTCLAAIERYSAGIAADSAVSATACGGTDENSNGNGSLMRILPVAFYLYRRYGGDFFHNDEAVEIVHDVSRLTHAHPRSLIACGSTSPSSLSGLCAEGRKPGGRHGYDCRGRRRAGRGVLRNKRDSEGVAGLYLRVVVHRGALRSFRSEP